MANTSKEESYYSVYAEHAKTLRAWLVAYGIGGPVLFLSNKELANKILISKDSALILSEFMIGVFSQVIITAFNKWISWDKFKFEAMDHRSWSYPFSNWASNQFWLDVLFDVISIFAFIIATYNVFIVVK